MKITALIPDALMEDVQRLSKGKNITESLVIALQEWRDLQKLKTVSRRLAKTPLKFSPSFSAEAVRSLNRK